MISTGKVLRCLACLWCLVAFVSSAKEVKDEQTEDDDATAFLLELVDNFKYMMKSGIKAANIPPLDPLIMEEDINIDFGKGSSKFTIFVAKGFKVDGLTDFELTHLRARTRQMYVNASLVVPKVVAEGRYDLNGKVLFVPLTGNGDFFARVDEISTRIVVALKEVDDHYQTDGFELDFEWAKLNVNMENIVDPNLAPVVNKIINGMGTKIYQRFKPIIMDILNKTLPPIFDTILAKYTIDDIKSGKFIPMRR